MRNAKRIGGVILLASSSWICGCNSDADTTLPEITSIMVDGLESAAHQVIAGEIMLVSLELHDNESLKQVKVNIHPADDGHTHGSGSGVVSQPNIGTWTYSSVIDIKGMHAKADLSLNVPLNIAGEWHLEVMAIDASGNEAIEQVVTIEVSNLEIPNITVSTNPTSDSGPIILTIADPNLSFSALVTDVSGIDSVYLEAATESGSIVYSQAFDAANLTEFSSGNLNIVFPAIGLYDISISALDVNGYENIWIREVEVQ